MRRITARASDLYKAHHGGPTEDAVGALRMIADSCEGGEWGVLESRSGEFNLFSGDGFSITLAPGGAVVSYSAGHRDRTWHQVRAGIRSRVSIKARLPSNRDRTLTASGVPIAEALSMLTPGEVLGGKVVGVASFGCFVEIDGVVGLLHRSQIDDTVELPQVDEVIRVVVESVEPGRLRLALKLAD